MATEEQLYLAIDDEIASSQEGAHRTIAVPATLQGVTRYSELYYLGRYTRSVAAKAADPAIDAMRLYLALDQILGEPFRAGAQHIAHLPREFQEPLQDFDRVRDEPETVVASAKDAHLLGQLLALSSLATNIELAWKISSYDDYKNRLNTLMETDLADAKERWRVHREGLVREHPNLRRALGGLHLDLTDPDAPRFVARIGTILFRFRRR